MAIRIVMRPGSLISQYKEPKENRAAYYQICYTLAMKGHTDYVRKDFVENIRQQIDAIKVSRPDQKADSFIHQIFKNTNCTSGKKEVKSWMELGTLK